MQCQLHNTHFLLPEGRVDTPGMSACGKAIIALRLKSQSHQYASVFYAALPSQWMATSLQLRIHDTTSSVIPVIWGNGFFCYSCRLLKQQVLLSISGARIWIWARILIRSTPKSLQSMLL